MANDNVIPDPGFEEGLGVWVSSRPDHAVVTWEHDIVHAGTGAMRLTRSTSDTGTMNAYHPTTYPAAGGQRWECSGWMYYDTGPVPNPAFRAAIIAMDAAGTPTYLYGSTTAASPGQWTYRVSTHVLPAGTVGVRAQLEGRQGWNTDQWWVLDDVELRRAEYLAAAVRPGDPLPYIELRIDAVPNPETITRWEVVRKSTGHPDAVVFGAHGTDPSGWIGRDGQAPLGVEVRYQLRLWRDGQPAETYTADPITIEGTRGCFLTDTASDRTIAVQIRNWDERDYAARQAVLLVANRPDPVVLSDVHTLPRQDVVFRTGSRAHLDALLSVLTGSNRIVLLRTQPTSSLATMYAAVGDITEERLDALDGTNWARDVTVDMQGVNPIPFTVDETHPATWEQLAGAFLTWADVPAAFPTWLDVSQWSPTT
jgi:hypothetical protein